MLSFYVTLDKRKDKSSHTVPRRCNLNPMQLISSFLPFPPVTTLRSPISQPAFPTSFRSPFRNTVYRVTFDSPLLTGFCRTPHDLRTPATTTSPTDWDSFTSSLLDRLLWVGVETVSLPNHATTAIKLRQSIMIDLFLEFRAGMFISWITLIVCIPHATTRQQSKFHQIMAGQIVSIGNDSLITAPEEPAQFSEKPPTFCTSFSKQPSPNLSQHMELHRDSSFANPPENRE